MIDHPAPANPADYVAVPGGIVHIAPAPLAPPELVITDEMVEVAAHALHLGGWSDCAFKTQHLRQARDVLEAVKPLVAASFR